MGAATQVTKMSTGVFITGTDTGVGKTWLAARLVRAWRDAGGNAAGFKPLVCGDRTDAFQLANASAGLTPDEVNPVWLKAPAAPYTAAMIEERAIDLSLVRERFAALRARFEILVVEGAGGWLVPVARDYSMADLAVEFALPVLCVVGNKLGCLNHALLTRDAIRARGLAFAGFVLNSGVYPPPADPTEAAFAALATNTNGAVLEDVSGERVIEIGMELDSATLAAITERFRGE